MTQKQRKTRLFYPFNTQIACLILAGLLFFAMPALAGGLFTVENIAADQTAGNATEAREQAIEAATREGFSTLAKRLAPNQEIPVGDIASSRLDTLVQDMEVDDEQITSNRYRAKLSITFNQEYVRALLKEYGQSVAASKEKPVLVIPVFIPEGGQAVLWDNGNPWATVWQNASLSGGLISIVVPSGDVNDEVALPIPTLLGEHNDAQREGITYLARKYGTRETLVLVAQQGQTAQGNVTVSLNIGFFDNSVVDRTQMHFIGKENEPLEAVLTDAASKVVGRLEQAWRQSQGEARVATHQIEAILPLRGLADWVSLRAKLAKTESLTRMEVRSLDVSAVTLSLAFAKNVNPSSALAKQGFTLSPKEDGGWILQSGNVLPYGGFNNWFQNTNRAP